jgi:hypothetical protein
VAGDAYIDAHRYASKPRARNPGRFDSATTLPVAVINPRRASHFFKAISVLARTDPANAQTRRAFALSDLDLLLGVSSADRVRENAETLGFK